MADKPGDADRKARLAQALRANLQRRKEQARRRTGSGQQADTTPADKPPQSPGNPAAPD